MAHPGGLGEEERVGGGADKCVSYCCCFTSRPFCSVADVR